MSTHDSIMAAAAGPVLETIQGRDAAWTAPGAASAVTVRVVLREETSGVLEIDQNGAERMRRSGVISLSAEAAATAGITIGPGQIGATITLSRAGGAEWWRVTGIDGLQGGRWLLRVQHDERVSSGQRRAN